MEVYRSDFKVSFKEDRSPVTEADMRSSEIIVQALMELFPVIPVLCEETSRISYEDRSTARYVWLVDPLDGTKEFIKKNDEFAVNIALVENNRVIAGLIHAPVSRTTYYAVSGMGAWKQPDKSAPVRLGNPDTPHTLEVLKVAMSRSHRSEEDDRFIQSLAGRYRKIQPVAFGSSLKFGLIAEGAADVYPKFGTTMEWDTASGQIILEETGGEICDVHSGVPLSYNKEDLRNPWFIARRKNIPW